MKTMLGGSKHESEELPIPVGDEPVITPADAPVDTQPVATPPATVVAAVLPPEPSATATSGEILKFLEETAKARKAIRKAENEALSRARQRQDEADNEVDKAWRAIMRLRMAKEAREKAQTAAAPQLPLE